MNSDDPCSPDHLAHRLMAAVENGRVREVTAYLKSGANPNWPDPKRKKSFTLGGGPQREYWPVIFPLQLVTGIRKPANRIPILKLLLAAGADLKLYFCWMSANGVFLEDRLLWALDLCELIHGWKQKPLYEDIIKWWLAQTSALINQWPEPADADLRKTHLKLHERLGLVSWSYGQQHNAANWALGNLL